MKSQEIYFWRIMNANQEDEGGIDVINILYHGPSHMLSFAAFSLPVKRRQSAFLLTLLSAFKSCKCMTSLTVINGNDNEQTSFIIHMGRADGGTSWMCRRPGACGTRCASPVMAMVMCSSGVGRRT